MKIRNYPVLIALTLLAGCGGSSSDQDVGTNPPPSEPPDYSAEPVFPGLTFSQPVGLLQAPGDASRWFVVEKAGVVRVFANDQNATSSGIFVDISSIVNSSAEGGLLGMAFDPDFPLTPTVYLSYTRSGSPLVSYLSRFTSTDNGFTLNPLSEEVLLTVVQPDNNHNGGDIAFGPDGYLYAAFGDGGGAGDPDGNGQDTNTLMGAILRLDVLGGSPYGIPAGNPFEANPVCTGGVGMAPCPEIYAWGLRNPWRISFDRVTGDLWAGDVGQNSWEEINLIEAGGNYGWNVREGGDCFEPPSGCADSFIAPVFAYDRVVGQSVTGGYVYRGSELEGLAGWYVYGDFRSGGLFAIPTDSSPVLEEVLLDETGLQIVSFAEDQTGELYVLHFGGTIHQLRNTR